MTEIRCVKCRRLLMKAKTVDAEIKCPKCGYTQKCCYTQNLMESKIWTYMGKPLKEVPTEALKEIMGEDKPEWWRPYSEWIDLRNAVQNELVKRVESDTAELPVQANYTGEIFDDQKLIDVLDTLPSR